LSTALEHKLACDKFIVDFAHKLNKAIAEDPALEVDGQVSVSWGQVKLGNYLSVYHYYPTNQLDVQFGRNGEVVRTPPELTLNADVVNGRWVDKFNQRRTLSHEELIEHIVDGLRQMAEQPGNTK
jgi:hypothetical protein